MKFLFACVFPLILTFNLNSQTGRTACCKDFDVPDDSILHFSDKMPEFGSAERSISDFIKDNLLYTVQTAVSGTCYFRFVVWKDGSIGRIQLLRGIEKECDDEALRVLTLMPYFIPGTNKGVPVNVWYTIPIKFTLN